MNALRPAVMTLTVCALVAGCASTSGNRETYEDPEFADAAFENFLVIGVAGSYNNRSQFERSVVSEIRATGAGATAFHVVVPGNDALSRETVLKAVSDGGFDAVLVTRVGRLDTAVDRESGSTDIKASTVGGRPVNFFRYDYEELNEPDSLSFNTTVTLATELFSAADEKMVWAIETSDSNVANAGVLIDRAAAAIVSRLERSRRIAN